MKEVELPEVLIRQAWNAQDPLASVHYYSVVMRIVVPAAFGLRMCLHCPDCNMEDQHKHSEIHSCSDYLGQNHKSLGGYAGLATAIAVANELQGEGTIHGHGFAALCNKYQHSDLEQIAEMIRTNIHDIPAEDMVKRVTDFMEHLHREDHFNDDLHQNSLRSLEEQFHQNNFGPPGNAHLSVRPSAVHTVTEFTSMWAATNARQSCFNTEKLGSAKSVHESITRVAEDAALFRETYEADVQFIFSRVQHHWHKLDKNGERQPI